MAYLAVNEALGVSLLPRLAPAGVPAAPTAVPAGFSALEWSVVALARHDRPSSLREPGRLARFLGALFGDPFNRRLADTRLEALRRMAVLTWHHSFAVPQREIAAFLSAGYSTDHYELLGKHVAHAHVARLFRK